ncbi:MAG TPA: helix-turn-helix transcriptional regulator [Actinomycetota bacterium]
MPRARTLDPGASMAACLGALLRHLRTLRGLTQAGLGAAAGFDGSYVGAVERAAVRPSRDLVERCDRALGAGGVLLALWPPADREWQARPTAASRPAEDRAAVPRQPGGRAAADPPGRRTRHPPGRAGPAAPDPEAEAVVEAMEVARRIEACDVGPGTLAAIEQAVERLATAGAGTPPALLIPAVRARRRYVERLLEERVTLGRRRRLLVVAGRLSLELARLHFDAGEREAAEANRDAAVRLARQAGDAEPAAAVEALACWALADGRFRDALELARDGQDLAPPASAVALQLALDEAEAWAALGDRVAAAGARRQAALTRAMLPGAGFPLPRAGPAAAAAS